MLASDVQISVLGDIAWQEILVPDGDNQNQYKRHTEWIGAPLIRQMIEYALTEGKQNPKDAEISNNSPTSKAPLSWLTCGGFHPDYGELTKDRLKGDLASKTSVYEIWDALIDGCGQYSATLATFPRRSRSVDKKDTVLRVAQDLRAIQAQPNDQQRIGHSLGKWAQEAMQASPKPRLIIIYDRGIVLRENIEPLKEVAKSLTPRDALIIAIEGEIGHGSEQAKIDQSLGSILAAIPSKARDRSIVLLTANSLRKFGLRIVEYGHVEQAVRDIVTQLADPPLRDFARRCRHIVVSNQEAALLHVVTPEKDDGSSHGPVSGSIHICPNWDKLAQGDSRRYGFMPGKLWIVLSALAMKVHKEIRNGSKPASWDLAPALRLGIAAFNQYASNGFDKAEPFGTIKTALSQEMRGRLRQLIQSRKREFLIASLRFTIDNIRGDMSWSRVSALIQGNTDERTMLYRIVEEGVDTAFREKDVSAGKAEPQNFEENPWFPGYAIDCPYAEFGDIKLIDEREITSYVSLSKLIEKYLRDEAWTKPLSIAVFGPPGSGKSFSVKEIIKSVSPVKADRDPLAFNLAQFSSVENLTEAFHLVQDRVLSSTVVPLVIFDEFDCYFEESVLGWLKYFLAPMQDGQFHGHNQDYRIGRSIFLFSGGTAETYKAFSKKLRKETEQRAQVKLDDFMSRLRGHLDVLSLNDEKSTPQIRNVRRAIVLRSILEGNAKPIFRPSGAEEKRAAIQRQVIDKFLHEWKYIHGVRSIEAVIQASRWIDGAFVLSSLPDPEQLASHVTSVAPLRAPPGSPQAKKRKRVALS